MRGGAQSHLMRCDDGNFYVVKFQNNPQHTRVLVNEWLATRLAERIGLPVPQVAIVEANEWIIANTPALVMDVAGSSAPCTPGLQFGARFVVEPSQGRVLDYMPSDMLTPEHVRNLEAFAGMLALDKWTGNSNGRQAVYWKKLRERKYSACFIDQGYCFNAGEWNFPDSALRGVFALNCVYESVSGWGSFEPWLSRIESFDPAAALAIADEVYDSDRDALEELVTELMDRRSKVRELITAFAESSREPFANWKKAFTADERG
jgi:hypothetical protein